MRWGRQPEPDHQEMHSGGAREDTTGEEQILCALRRTVDQRNLMITNIVKPQTRPSVKTALLLAAGTGSRLLPLTHDAPKYLTK